MLSVSTEKYESELLNIELEIYEDDQKIYWFHGATLCDIFDLPNPSQAVQRHVDDDWRKKFPVVHGKDAWFVMEPGFYQLLHASKHPAAKRFQRWVYSEVLPKLRASGGYVMPNATSKQLEALQSEVQSLQEQNKLLADNRLLTGVVRDFMLCCIDYVPRSYVRSAEWMPALKKFIEKKHGKDFYNQLNPTGKEVIVEMDSILKSSSQPKPERIYMDIENGFGDLENAVLKPKDEREFSSSFATVGGYPSNIGE